jgi:RHS repeat-associated protein
MYVQSRYTGKERDTESGNDYFGARYYSSNMGRFSSPGPSGLYYADPTNPQSLNLYSYALNNPLKFIDPTGLYCDYSDHNDPSSGFVFEAFVCHAVRVRSRLSSCA